jgi:hypothetical protein
MSKKIYRGRRHHNRVDVEVVENGKSVRLLRHFIYHSPEGFDWGGGGDGSSELALGILLDYFGELPTKAELYLGAVKALEYHQRFKWAFIAPIDTSEWEIALDEITAWLEGLGLEDLFGLDVRIGKERGDEGNDHQISMAD